MAVETVRSEQECSADVDSIIRYEAGEMDEEETVEFFQNLIDSGLAWKLQGHYGCTASALIRAGHCTYGLKN